MFMFLLIGLSLILTGIVGLQFTYLFYVDRIYRERRTYLHTLEKKCTRLAKRLEAAENQIAEQKELLLEFNVEMGKDGEAWADVIEDR